MTERAAVAIEVSDLRVRFGDETVLDGIDLTVEEGEFLSVLGPSGCGKSTMLRIFGDLAQAEGEVKIFGEPHVESWQKLAYVFQQPRLLPWRTALSNVMLGVQLRQGRGDRPGRRARAQESLDRVGLGHLPNRRAHVLSGGEQQRVAIARGLSVDPRILLMDEPFSALDIQTRTQLRRQIVSLWQETGLTTVFVTHDVDEAIVVSNRIVVFSPKPTRVVADIRLTADHPRDPRDPSLDPVREEIVEALGGLEVLRS